MLALDPHETFDVPFGGAVFTFRYLTFREFRRVGRLYDANTDKPFDAVLDDLLDAVKTNLVGWSGVTARDGTPIPFSLDRLDDVITMGEAWDLLGQSRTQSRLSVTEKNVSGSASPTNTGGSADGAIPGNAPTRPAPGSLPCSSAPDATGQDATIATDGGM
jgi:hypothetical protein